MNRITRPLHSAAAVFGAVVCLGACTTDSFYNFDQQDGGLAQEFGVSGDSTPDPTGTIDNDGDKYSEAQGDCDDNDPKTHPNAVEICTDGKDNNCNGTADLFEPDGDGDGFGPCQGDCNDNDNTISPSVPEVPDGKDNNCDGIIDGDYDGDGYTTAKGDCDDKDQNVYPGAKENCFDGKDND